MLRYREFDTKRAIDCLSRYGSSKAAAKKMNLSQTQFCRAFKIITDKEPSKYPLMTIEESGRSVIVTPREISNYLRQLGLKSMEQDDGRFEGEIRSALRNLNGHREQPKVNGNFMHPGPTGGNGANGAHNGGPRGAEYTHLYPITIVERGRSATIAPENVAKYLKQYGLDSMKEECYRHLEREVRTALGKINGRNGRQIATGIDMKFTFRKTGDGYAIAHLTVSQLPFDLSRLLPEHGPASHRDGLVDYTRWPFNCTCVYGNGRRYFN